MDLTNRADLGAHQHAAPGRSEQARGDDAGRQLADDPATPTTGQAAKRNNRDPNSQ